MLLILFSLLGALPASADPLVLKADENGFTPAPIHGQELQFKVHFNKRPWPKDRDEPEVVARSLWVHWEGHGRNSAKGHPLPVLVAHVTMAVPAGAHLVTQSSRPLEPRHLPAGDRDTYTFDLNVTKLRGNEASFFLKFDPGEVNEFELEYGLALTESVAAISDGCAPVGVRLTEQDRPDASDRLPSFLFVNCVREDRMLYVNVGKPADLKLEAPAVDVIKLPLRTETQPVHEPLPSLRLTDGTRRSSRFDLSFDSEGPTGFRFALGVAPSFSTYKDNFQNNATNISQMPFLALLSTGYQFPPGYWEVGLDLRATIGTIMISDTSQPAASWYSLGYNMGFLLPVDRSRHVFGVTLGWYHYFMTVSGNAYGTPRQGFSNLSGPQLGARMRFGPVGSLGWDAYTKFALLSNTLETLDFGKLQRHELTVGASLDLPLAGNRVRRPAVFVEGGFVAVSLNSVDMNENHVTAGILYPLR